MRSLGKRAKGERLERMKASPLWEGRGFRNIFPKIEGLRSGGMPPVVEFLRPVPSRFPARPLACCDPRPSWLRPPETGFRATWLGHSTVLIEIDGAVLLTDPVWGERVSPLNFAGPRRFQPVPVEIGHLPQIDAILVSHDHYDHLDHPTVVELARRNTPFVTSLGVGAHLEAWGVPTERITELDWWESFALPGADVTVTATPSQHFSGRSLGGRNATLWSSFSVRGPEHAFFFSGDTGLTNEYAEIRTRLGQFDLVMLEVGAFHPAWGDIHLGPDRAIEALALLGGGALLPIHWGTFNLAIHDWDEPAERLVELAPQKHVRLVMPRLGEAIELSRFEESVPWWRSAKRSDVERAIPQASGAEPKSAEGTALEWPID